MPKPALDLKSLARGYTEACVKTLGSIVCEDKCPPSARVSAATVLLERGWGKSPQPLTGENGEGEITIVIRRLMDEDAMKAVSSTTGRVIKTIDQVVTTAAVDKDADET